MGAESSTGFLANVGCRNGGAIWVVVIGPGTSPSPHRLSSGRYLISSKVDGFIRIDLLTLVNS